MIRATRLMSPRRLSGGPRASRHHLRTRPLTVRASGHLSTSLMEGMATHSADDFHRRIGTFEQIRTDTKHRGELIDWLFFWLGFEDDRDYRLQKTARSLNLDTSRVRIDYRELLGYQGEILEGIVKWCFSKVFTEGEPFEALIHESQRDAYRLFAIAHALRNTAWIGELDRFPRQLCQSKPAKIVALLFSDWLVSLRDLFGQAKPEFPDPQNMLNQFLATIRTVDALVANMRRLNEAGFTLAQLNGVRERVVTNADEDVRFMTQGLAMVRSVDDFLCLTRYPLPNPSERHREAMRQFVRAHYQAFLDLRPTLEQTEALISQIKQHANPSGLAT